MSRWVSFGKERNRRSGNYLRGLAMFKCILPVSLLSIVLGLCAPGSLIAGQPGYRSIRPYRYSGSYAQPYRIPTVVRPYYSSYGYSRSYGYGYSRSYGYGYTTPYTTFYRGPVVYPYPTYSGSYGW